MIRRGLASAAALLALVACTSGTPAPPFPEQLTLSNLLSMAQAGQPYLGDPVIPMSAVVTPPGMDIFFRAPPFGTSEDSFVNTGSEPVLNLLPAISQGHFTPYVSMEFWTNDFGPVWVQPLYQLIEVDSNDNAINEDANTQPGMPANPFVLSTAPPDRFYTPFWRFRNVLIPEAMWPSVIAHPPQSERDVLDLPVAINDGPLMLASIIPDNLVLDAPLVPPPGVPGGTMPLPAPPTGFAPWMSAILNADYTADGLKEFNTLQVVQAIWQGQQFTAAYFGEDWFTEQTGNVVPPTPIYVWVDLNAAGEPVPIGLPNVAGVDAPFSGTPWDAPGGQPDWDSFWEVYYVVRPTGALPFYPVVPSPTDPVNVPDLFGGQREKFSPGTAPPSPVVNALPNVARYATRLALNPGCFSATSVPSGDMPGSTTMPLTPADTKAWAATCGFLDSQAALEANITQENFIDQQLSALCPLMLWAPGYANP